MIFDSIVFDSVFDGKLVIEFSEKHQVIQRRKYVRMPYITDFFLERESGNIKTQTVDISGGGVRFLTDKLLASEQHFKAQLRLNNFEPMIKVEGHILKKNFYKTNEYVMEFAQIEEKDREKIIQKCRMIEFEQIKNS